jgi:succinoglycan biosynthesis protein ExoM
MNSMTPTIRLEVDMTGAPAASPALAIVVAVCTYRRNDPLRRLLQAVEANAWALGDRARVGVVVVDDNPDQRAGAVVEDFRGSFELGLAYRTLGRGNISLGRNLALDAGLELLDRLGDDVPTGCRWIAMTDDDCEPPAGWLSAYADAIGRQSADVFTSSCRLVSASAPTWLLNSRLLRDGMIDGADLSPSPTAATNNSIMSYEFLTGTPPPRFEETLGVVGGEDMVFFRTAVSRGRMIRFVPSAELIGHEPPERTTLRAVMRSRMWLGNTEGVTNLHLGEASRARLVLRGARIGLRALVRPAAHLVSGRPPEFAYTAGQIMRSLGMIGAAAGVRLRHH